MWVEVLVEEVHGVGEGGGGAGAEIEAGFYLIVGRWGPGRREDQGDRLTLPNVVVDFVEDGGSDFDNVYFVGI